jgi:aldehyde dehydrogenase (NAD+)
MNQELIDAVKADIGREDFVTWFSEVTILEKEIDHTISNLEKWTKDIVVDTPVFLGPARSKIVHEPLGVIAIFGSWNFPLYTTLSPLISVIAAGNTAVIKPSEISASTLRKIKAIFARNMDTSAYVCIEGAVKVAQELSKSKLDGICFTGSTEKGKEVASAAGENLVPCVLELGGKSPVIVDESANLELAAKKIVLGKFINAGQVCIAPDYILISHTVVAEFVKILQKQI